jgi:short-subunit dehydrogenase
MNLSKSTVLLTGATGGIGNEITRQLVCLGADVIAVSRSRESLEKLTREIEQKNNNARGKITCLQADLCVKKDRDKVIEHCRSLPGGLSILINNAGINHFGLLPDRTDEQIEQIFTINTLVPMFLCRALVPLLKQNKNSVIVNVGSTFGSIGFAGFVPYSASKYALRGFSEALRRELAATSIKVHYLAPRATQTDFNSDQITAMNQQLGNAMDSPGIVAASIVKTIINGRYGESYLGWPEKLFVKINALFPGLVDRALRKKLAIIRSHANSSSPDPNSRTNTPHQ